MQALETTKRVATCAALLLLITPTHAQAATWIVDAGCTPPTGCDCDEIQPCVEMAAAGDTVLVMPGTYTTTDTRTLDIDNNMITLTAVVFMKDGVHLMSGGGGATIIDGGRSAVCVVAPEVAAGTILTGFTIQNGAATGSGFNSVGGGMLCLGANPTVANNGFRLNTAGGQGGGLACELDSSPTIENNIFDVNTATVDGGGIYCCGGAAVIRNNVFDSNVANEGAAIRYIAAGSITGNTFRANVAQGGLEGDIAMTDGTENGPSVTVTDNVFHDNTSALFLITAPTTSIQRNTMIRGRGGIVSVGTDDTILIDNNLIVTNTVGIQWTGLAPAMTCNDIWQNDTNYIGLPDVTGQSSNISLDPLHCDPQGNDFTLAANSPCAAANSGQCGTIGAFDENCPPSAIEQATWGSIKSSYKPER